MLHTLLRTLVERAWKPSRSGHRRARLRPRVEALEDRYSPAVVYWANPLGGDWQTPANWSTGVVPSPADDVVIATAVAGQAEVICTWEKDFHDPPVKAQCVGLGIRVLKDAELLAELRNLNPPQP